ncbi:MAG: HEAT repeat domain-containing protein, partial [Legionellaceae bacterium]
DSILKKYGQQIQTIAEGMNPSSPPSAHDLDALAAKKMILLDQMKKDGGLIYADWSTVFYPDHQPTYTTIEVIPEHDVVRVNYLKKMQKDDLINTMMTYQMLAFKLMLAGELDKNPIQCPFYHCITGYEHPKLKPFLPLFKVGAVRDKTLVLKTLTSDLDPNRRALAALLVGHLNDPHEIVRVLLPYIHDADVNVRNNALRVIGETITRGKLTDIDASPFITLLDSPDVTDRNKSLLVLLSVMDSKEVQQRLRAEGVERLMKLLALKQPNNHDPAYLLLKKISGQDFGEHNIAAWQHWASDHKTA